MYLPCTFSLQQLSSNKILYSPSHFGYNFILHISYEMDRNPQSGSEGAVHLDLITRAPQRPPSSMWKGIEYMVCLHRNILISLYWYYESFVSWYPLHPQEIAGSAHGLQLIASISLVLYVRSFNWRVQALMSITVYHVVLFPVHFCFNKTHKTFLKNNLSYTSHYR